MLGALELALLGPHLALGQRVVLVAAAVPDGVEVVADPNESDPEAARSNRRASPELSSSRPHSRTESPMADIRCSRAALIGERSLDGNIEPVG